VPRIGGGRVAAPGAGGGGTSKAPAALNANLPIPSWVLHRGGGSSTANAGAGAGPYPEETMEAFRASAGLNIPGTVVNPHWKILADGTLASIHDSTLDRVTTGTGSIYTQTAATWMLTTIDAGAWWAAPWGNLKTTTADDVLREFGGKVNIGAEISGTGSGAAATALIQRYGLTDCVWLASFDINELAAPRDAGIMTQYLPAAEGTAGTDAASILARNAWAPGLPKHVGVDIASSDAYITSLVAAGLKVSLYSLTRRIERDRALRLGAISIVSDDPYYQSRDVAITKTADTLAAGTWPHGLQAADQSHGRGKLLNGGLQLDFATGTQWVVPGWLCPVGAPTAYTLDFDQVWDAVPTDTTRWAGCHVANGQFSVVRLAKTGQTGTNVLNNVATGVPVITNGTTVHWRVAVTATAISTTFTVGGTAYGPFTATDATYRGGYLHIGKTSQTGQTVLVTYKALAIT
jgi:glycerophosphoryl diester phosphodiesterase